MIQVDNIEAIDFEKIDIDPFWNVGSEREHKGHRIHAYPAKFPAFITQKAIQYSQNNGINIKCVADIFCGCGTVALEAKRLGIDFWGCDLNPTAVLIAKAKSNTYIKTKIDVYYKAIIDYYDKMHSIYVLRDEVNERLLYWFYPQEIHDLSDLAPENRTSYNVRKKRKTTNKGAERRWQERTTQLNRSLSSCGR